QPARIQSRDGAGTVLHFIDTTGPGGGETIFLQVAAGMRERGWHPRTIVLGPGWVLDNANALNLPVDQVSTSGRFDVGYIRRIRQLTLEHDVDLIHAHLFSPAVYASLVGALTGTPVVATFHGASDTDRGGAMRDLRYRLISHQAHVVCVSESLRTAARQLPGLRKAAVSVVPNGIDTVLFGRADGGAARRSLGVADSDVLVGAVGNVREAKDFGTLLRAAALLAPDPRIRFAIIGERTEPLHGELLAIRNALNLGDRVTFHGFRTDVPELMAAFDLLAISSSSEGFSLAAVQAMAAGRAVVATRSGGPEEIITSEIDGILVPVSDPAALAGAIRRVADDPALRDRLGSAARRTAADRFSMSAMLDGYERIYREATGSGTCEPSGVRAPAENTFS
ncbi:MAG TPA: glycosyltransferase family 4 protein, partial [Longimicrobiales bacterium]